ncbi:toxin TcdB middle/N-terminal domain-containing protein [Pelagibius sp. CAU 1746]|uniref:toxin TcdB middle/N-terminal domain-containing protein n=1 Tax=Pelagibius sp. CAU 1746 TaxID=3140370 RepID=UPI00325BA0D7
MKRRSDILRPSLATALALGVLQAVGSLQSAQAQATVAGVTSGALSVDETGSAGYTIPIAVPPGIAGMQPSLALVYQSHGGNGTAGVGWGLSASSSIHRCSQTLAQDGAIHGVDFSAQDRFCLDGQRLVAISGAYGADGSEYRTEIDSFARITSHGTAGTGPLSFTVETKSGRTLEYGNTADARLGVAAASEIRLWSLNKVSDTLGNAMTYHYVEGAADSSYRLDRIEYTSNAGQSVLPQSEVRFVYEARPDVRTSYLAGAKLAMTKRLAAVETWSGSGSGLALVKRYSLTYETSPATSRSRLTSITECDANSNCLQPVSLGWQGSALNYTKEIVNDSWGMSVSAWAADKRTLHILDYNGDGRSDILVQAETNSLSSVLLTSNGNGFDKSIITDSWGMSASAWAGDKRVLHILDYNGDGLSDILVQGKTDGLSSALLTSNGSGFDKTIIDSLWGMSNSAWSADKRILHPFDYNGDGLTDILVQGRTNSLSSVLLTSNGTGFEKAVIDSSWGLTLGALSAAERILHVFDYNGDGLDDILIQGKNSNNGTSLLTSNGSGFDRTVVTNSWGMSLMGWAAVERVIHTIDHNGDGLDDILIQGIDDTHITALLTSNGTGFAKRDVTNSWGMSLSAWGANRRTLHVLDHNGDGLSDILAQGKSAPSLHSTVLLTSTGAEYTKTVVSDLWNMDVGAWASDERILHILDYNGDGLPDILGQGKSSSLWTFTLTHSGPAPDLLASITDSLGRVSTLDYAPLTEATVYAKDSDAVFPVVDIQAPLYVVKSVSSDDGVGGQKVTSYSYAGAKVHVQGRGFRGFRQMKATDQQTGIVTTTDYSQVFPTTAQVLTSVKRLSDGATIKTIANTWDQLSLNTGKTVWPYVASSTSEDYEPNDGVGNLPVVSRTATAVFDVYGNPTNLTTTTTGGGETFTETTVNSYQNIATPTRWLPGLVTRSEVTRSRPGAP